MRSPFWKTILLGLALALVLTASASAQVAKAEVYGHDVVWAPEVEYSSITLTVSGPNGVTSRTFDAGEVPTLEAFDLVDGSYTWELRAAPVLGPEDRAALAQAQANSRGLGIAKRGLVQSGHVTVSGGAFVPAYEEPSNPTAPAEKDSVILDDLIVAGSACVGLDCVNGESFGFDTLRLKENNLRIKFQDTSGTNFPSNDWQITANDSTSGGANRFSIDDIDGGATPFTIEAGADGNSIYVDSGGRVGIGTSAPVVNLHVVHGDTATLRLEQDGSAGFTPQTWDVGGNETNWFVRDATNGSPLPLRIRPSAPMNSLFIDTDGDVGLGTASPSARLDVIGSAEVNGVAYILDSDDNQFSVPLTVQNNGMASGRTIIKAINQGQVKIGLTNQLQNRTWNIDHRSGGQFVLDLVGVNTDEFTIDVNGNVTTLGTVNGVSDVNKKRDFETVDTQAVLDAVASMPITTWAYKSDEGIRHMGPMAQDFHAAFGLGVDERHISFTDTAGVALAAIQALEQENRELKERMEALEALVHALGAQD